MPAPQSLNLCNVIHRRLANKEQSYTSEFQQTLRKEVFHSHRSIPLGLRQTAKVDEIAIIIKSHTLVRHLQATVPVPHKPINMRLILSTAIITVALFGYASAYAEAYPSAQESQSQTNPSDGLSLKTPTYAGCFSNSGSLVDQGFNNFQALGWCQPWCVRQNKPVVGFSNGTNCWCGDKLPPASDKVSDDECGIPCNGYDKDKCKSLISLKQG